MVEKLLDFFKKERIIQENLLQCSFVFGSGLKAAEFIVDFYGENNISAGEELSEGS
jgi:hypothetical protein